MNAHVDASQGRSDAEGILKPLSSVDDLKLDVPAAEDDLALFLARAVVDDILPPAPPAKEPLW
ncbi:MA3 DOMAIN-CONTAINING TRANSLATION REGULATORY FACTOR 2 [Trebouxia sp. C0010 RCD-2024]